MSGWRLGLLVLALGLMGGAMLGWWVGQQRLPAAPAETSAGAAIGQDRPDFLVPDLQGRPVSAADFDGRPMLVNFWATWCEPCRREMPLLEALSREHGQQLAVIGIALDDRELVQDFVEELGIGYVMLADYSSALNALQAWGNAAGALPYSVLVDAQGIIRWQYLGEVSRDELDRQLEAHLR